MDSVGSFGLRGSTDGQAVKVWWHEEVRWWHEEFARGSMHRVSRNDAHWVDGVGMVLCRYRCLWVVEIVVKRV